MTSAARPATGWRRRAGPASAPRFRAGQADGSTSRSSAGARRRRVQGTRASAFPDLRPAPTGWPHSTGAPTARKGPVESVADQGAHHPGRPVGNGDPVVVRVGDVETAGIQHYGTQLHDGLLHDGPSRLITVSLQGQWLIAHDHGRVV